MSRETIKTEARRLATFLNEDKTGTFVLEEEDAPALPAAFVGWVWSDDDGLFSKGDAEVSFNERSGKWRSE